MKKFTSDGDMQEHPCHVIFRQSKHMSGTKMAKCAWQMSMNKMYVWQREFGKIPDVDNIKDFRKFYKVIQAENA